jgi:hypothetical protein
MARRSEDGFWKTRLPAHSNGGIAGEGRSKLLSRYCRSPSVDATKDILEVALDCNSDMIWRMQRRLVPMAMLVLSYSAHWLFIRAAALFEQIYEV